MRRLLLLFVALLLLGGVEVAVAQDGNPVLFSVYYACDQNRELAADLIMESAIAPILDRHVEAGDLAAWGWLAHRVGGSWRRAEFMMAPDFETLMSARNAMVEERQQEAAAAVAALNDICPDHDDYVWTRVAASAPLQATGLPPAPARMSTYYRCNAGTVARADEIFNEVMAPILNRHTAASALRSWAWWAHLVGGEYRRFLTVNAVDGPTLYTHWGAAMADMGSQAPEAYQEFNRLCGAHTDYQWAGILPSPGDG